MSLDEPRPRGKTLSDHQLRAFWPTGARVFGPVADPPHDRGGALVRACQRRLAPPDKPAIPGFPAAALLREDEPAYQLPAPNSKTYPMLSKLQTPLN